MKSLADDYVTVYDIAGVFRAHGTILMTL